LSDKKHHPSFWSYYQADVLTTDPLVNLLLMTVMDYGTEEEARQSASDEFFMRNPACGECPACKHHESWDCDGPMEDDNEIVIVRYSLDSDDNVRVLKSRGAVLESELL